VEHAAGIVPHVFSLFGLVTGAVIVISVSDKSVSRWVIWVTDIEQEQSLTLKIKL